MARQHRRDIVDVLEGVLRQHDVKVPSKALLGVRNEVDDAELDAIAKLWVVFGDISLRKLDAVGIEVDAEHGRAALRRIDRHGAVSATEIQHRTARKVGLASEAPPELDVRLQHWSWK